MLTLSQNATEIVKRIADQPEAVALRIAGDSQPEASFAVAAVTQAEPEDQVVEQDGATVYLDATAAEQLDDKVLDAAVDPAGNLEFRIELQA